MCLAHWRSPEALDHYTLTRALNEIIRRHEILRTRFIELEGEPVQVVQPVQRLILPLVDLRALPTRRCEEEVEQLLTREAAYIFDLARDNLLRILLLQRTDDEHVMLVNMHHIISDAWSKRILTSELAVIYGAFCADEPSPLPELPVQYADFAIWQRQYLQGERLESLLSYWQGKLGPKPPVLNLPTDFPRPERQSNRGGRVFWQAPEILTSRLEALGQDQDCTSFMVCLAAFKMLLSVRSGQDDIIVDCNIANRSHVEVESLIGMFLNVLLLRTDLSGDPTFGELLARLRATAVDAYAHEALPFEKLVELLQPARTLAQQQPLSRVKVDFQNIADAKARLPGLDIRSLPVGHVTTHADLSLYMYRSSDSLTLVLEYSVDLFLLDTIQRWMEDLGTLLEQATVRPTARLSELRAHLERLERQRWLTIGRDIKATDRQKFMMVKRRAAVEQR